MHEHGDLDRTRTAEQRAAYEQTVGKGICPFCGDLATDIRPHVIHEGVDWRAWFNPHPYPSHAAHIMVVPREHWTQPSDVGPAAAAEWFAIVNMLIETLNLPGGGIVMRFGDHEHKGGSITHLHSHIQVPDQTGYSIATFYEDEALKQFFKHGPAV